MDGASNRAHDQTPAYVVSAFRRTVAPYGRTVPVRLKPDSTYRFLYTSSFPKRGSDRLIEREVNGPVDLAHAAAPEQRHKPIAARDDRAGRKTAGRRRAAGCARGWRDRDVIADAAGDVGI